MNYLGGVIEKAVYADTPQNRKLGRVGKEWGTKSKSSGLPTIKYNSHYAEEDVPSPPSARHGATKRSWELHLKELQKVLPTLKYKENIENAKKKIKNAKAKLKQYETYGKA